MGNLFSQNESLEFFIPASYEVAGPLGLGDPKDHSLSEFEKDTIVPTFMISEAKKRWCREEWDSLADCDKKNKWLAAVFCRDLVTTAIQCNLRSTLDDAKQLPLYILFAMTMPAYSTGTWCNVINLTEARSRQSRRFSCPVQAAASLAMSEAVQPSASSQVLTVIPESTAEPISAKARRPTLLLADSDEVDVITDAQSVSANDRFYRRPVPTPSSLCCLSSAAQNSHDSNIYLQLQSSNAAASNGNHLKRSSCCYCISWRSCFRSLRWPAKHIHNENLFVMSLIQLLCGFAAVILSGVAYSKVLYCDQIRGKHR
ncbi:Mitochondrial aspartate/glutamate carrier protein [Cichlidogyrus casuarinus]|uniref:Mitochondrial aspartate/glutamate carrier protein n=1 Tax=Cichlidogyrus casuarinus TaxID=1844966 RepID=A0ABD2QD62_9PLAT